MNDDEASVETAARVVTHVADTTARYTREMSAQGIEPEEAMKILGVGLLFVVGMALWL